MNGPIVSPEWLHAHLSDPELIILDASAAVNEAGLTSPFKDQKIPHSRFFDLKDHFSDSEKPFPNTFPSTEQSETGCRNLGIHNSSHIIVYDDLGIYQSPRAWWMFKAMGHTAVYVLDGGLPAWIAAGYQTVTHYEEVKDPGTFSAQLQPSHVKDFAFVRSNIHTQNYIVVDARSQERFQGCIPERRKGLRSGNIPNSINIPYASVLENGKIRSENELKQLFEAAGIDDRPLTFSCGSGVTACIVLLAAEISLKNTTSIYDGSWTEYGSLTAGTD